MVYLERKLKDESMESKITRFGLVFVEKSKNEVDKNFLKLDHKITKINDEIKLNYYP